jgi:excisionase family DNA binding protein
LSGTRLPAGNRQKSTRPRLLPPAIVSDDYSTLEVARLLGMAVRSVQMMVDRGELEAWKTPGGHRRISRASVERWRATRQHRGAAPRPAPSDGAVTAPAPAMPPPPTVLLIEDSVHYQNLIGLLVRQQFPGVSLQVADDGIAGLAMAGRLQPQVMIVDILLPGIDGATLITSLRSHPQFKGIRLIVVTSLDEAGREPYGFALAGLPVIHKTRLVADLPAQLAAALGEAHRAAA